MTLPSPVEGGRWGKRRPAGESTLLGEFGCEWEERAKSYMVSFDSHSNLMTWAPGLHRSHSASERKAARRGSVAFPG